MPNDEGILYGDDTVLVYVVISLTMHTEHVNSQLREIFKLCSCNKLSLNTEKTELMTLTNKIVANHPQLFIGIGPIEDDDSFKYLGIHVETRPKFNV